MRIRHWVVTLLVIAVLAGAWLAWPFEWYEARNGFMVRVNRYTGSGCEFMPHDRLGQIPILCSDDARKTFPPRPVRS